MIKKKSDWKKGEWAFGLKVITPAGTTIEYDCGHVKEKAGQDAYDAIMKALGMK